MSHQTFTATALCGCRTEFIVDEDTGGSVSLNAQCPFHARDTPTDEEGAE